MAFWEKNTTSKHEHLFCNSESSILKQIFRNTFMKLGDCLQFYSYENAFLFIPMLVKFPPITAFSPPFTSFLFAVCDTERVLDWKSVDLLVVYFIIN